MTPQEIFETVVKHCFNQGRQAIDFDAYCKYRTKNGLKCAAGCLIPDENYKENMENKCILYVAKNYPLPEYFIDNIHLIQHLQAVHDDLKNWKNSEILKQAFSSIGQKYNLDTSFIRNLVLNR